MKTKKIIKILSLLFGSSLLFSCGFNLKHSEIVPSVKGITASDANAENYSISDIYANVNALSVKLVMTDNTLEGLSSDKYSYVIKNSSNEVIDHNSPFTNEGNYELTVTYGQFVSNIIPLKVKKVQETVNVNSISLNKDNLSLEVGDLINLTATISPSNATNKKITWASSDETVATVIEGSVKGISEGNAVITATTVDGNKTSSCNVKVNKTSEIVTFQTIFNTYSTDASSETSASSILSTLVKSNNLIENVTSSSKAYKGKSGLKLGSSSAGGSIDFTLVSAASLKVKRIIVPTAVCTDSGNTLSLAIDGQTLITVNAGENLIYSFEQFSEVSTISLKSSKRIYISGITCLCGPIYPTNILINDQELGIAAGNSKQLNVEYLPSNTNAGKGISWSRASGSNLINVTSSGLVQVSANATNGETAVIKATSTYDSSLVATTTIKVVVTQKDAWTILIYMVGNNLESDVESGEVGLASLDIEEMLSVSGQPKDVNIAIQTCGTNINNDYFSTTKMNRWHISNQTMVLDASINRTNTGSSSTFANFMKWGLETYPAEKTGVILWDHGGGMQGVCYDELNSNNPLLNSEVKAAMDSLKLTSKLEFIGYDACLMSMQDIAEFNSYYFNYMVASQESENGEGWDYDTWLDDLYTHKPTTTILKAICDGFISENDYYYTISGRRVYDPSNNDQTLAVLDLSKIATLKDSFETLASLLINKLSQSTNYQNSFKNLVNKCKYYGGKDYLYYGFYDLYDFLTKLSSNSTFNVGTTYINNVKTAHQNVVYYNKIGQAAGNSYGLSLFYAVSSYTRKGTYYSSSETNFENWRTLNSTYGY